MAAEHGEAALLGFHEGNSRRHPRYLAIARPHAVHRFVEAYLRAAEVPIGPRLDASAA